MQSNTRSQGNNITLVRPSIPNKALTGYSFSKTQMLVFVDPSLKDVMMLVAGVQPKAEVIFIDPEQDAIEQITQILSQRTSISSVHLVAHGSPGSLQLGSSELSLNTLNRYANQLQAWSNSLRGASLFIYGCQIASGDKGVDFLQQLHQLTQANIAASTNKVGSQKLGGNWELEYQIGQITSELAFLPSVMEAYPGVFVNYNESVDGDISDNPNAPLSLELEEGTNSLSASSTEGDLEYVTVTIPNGFQLDSLFLSNYASLDPVAFVAVQSGTTFTEPTSGTDVGNLLGWSHFGSAQEGTDILDNIGTGSGTIGFSAPLPSGDYTFWLQQLGEPTNYTLDFNVSAEEPTMPTVSLQTISGTFDSNDNIVASNLIRSIESAASLLTFAFKVDGEIPEGGLVVDVNSDISLMDYFTGLGGKPFSPGGEVLEAIYDSETGEGTGFKFRIDQPNAILNFRLLNNPEAEGEVPATFTLAAAEGYTIDPEANTSSVTFYDTLASVPAPTVTPEVSFSVSNTALVESEGTITTVSFSLSEAPPPEGVLVYVASPSQFLGDFNILNAEVEGGVFPAPNFSSSGFYFKIFEQEASITLSAFPDDINEEGEFATEGIESFTISLQSAPGYTIAPGTEPVTITVADTPESQLQVSLTATPATLIESEGTLLTFTFTLSEPPPPEGVTVTVNGNVAQSLNQLDVFDITVEGGQFPEPNFDFTGFSFTITSQSATINAPIFLDNDPEDPVTVTYTLATGDGYEVDPNNNQFSVTFVDTPDQTPPPTSINEPNDIISLATDTGLSASSPFVSFTSTLDHETANRYPVEGGFLYVDATEDVDLYKVNLKAGDTIKIDTDSNQFAEGRKVDTWLRVFDSAGAELASNDDGASPDEVFDAEFQSYIEFTAPTDGVYYIGASLYNNGEYDPLTPASGTGNGDLDPNEYGAGEYTLNISLNDPAAFTADPTEIPAGTGEGPVISLFTVAGTYGNDFDTLGFDIVAPGLAETVSEDAGSALNFVLTANGIIPEGGIEVYINSDIAFPDYFGNLEAGDYSVAYGGNLNGKPFSRGGEFLNAVYDEDGKATGFKFLLKESFATITLNPSNREEAEIDGPETATFSLVASAGYTLSPLSSSTVTFYDTVEQIPAPTTTPEVSLEISTTELIESEETEFTLTLSLSEPPPPEGVQVYVSGNAQDFLNEFVIFEAQFTGGIPISDGAVSGFYFQMFAQTATITLPVFNSIDVTEGIEQFDVSLVPGTGYTVNPDSTGELLTIKDTPDSQIQVSLSTESETLIESEGTVATLNLSLSAAPPEEGVTVTVNAPAWLEFDPATLEATGGELVGTSPDNTSFTFNITDQDATISFAVDDDGVAEAVEQATFTVVEAEGYQVNLSASSSTFTIADTPELAPTSIEEANDTIETAIATGLTTANPNVTFEGEIDQYFAEDADGNELTVDASEDVDFYSFALKAGEKVAIDVDSVEYEIEGLVPQRLDSELRLFNAAGTELALNTSGFAPDELFVANRDAYLEFTATEDATYYVGVAQWNNRFYDPFTAGTGSGRISPDSGINVGPYTLDIDLMPADPVVSLTATPALIEEGGEAVTFNFNVTGDFPTDGLIIGTTELFDSQFDFNFEFEDPQYLSGIEFFDYVESETGEVTVFWTLTQPDAFIKVKAFDDNIAEEDVTFTLGLRSGEGYTVDPIANETTITISDGVPNIGGPIVSLGVEPTNLNEGDSLTITINADGVIPAEGLEVNIDSDIFASLGEFAIFDPEGNSLVQFEGLAGAPLANEDASGFSAVLTGNTATLTLDVFDDGPGEGIETIDFAVLDGENYEVDPTSSAVTLTLNDGPTTPVVSLTATPEIINEAEGTALTLAFDTIGTIPTEGITVSLKGDVSNILTQFTAAQLRFDAEGNPFYRFDRNLEITGGTLDVFSLDNSDVSSFTFTILEPTATIKFPVLDDVFEESDQTYTYTLEPGDGYEVASTANSASFTVTDGVPGGVGPTIGVSANPTTLFESEQTAVTLTFTLDSPPPAEGVVVYLDSGVPLTIAEFDVPSTTVTGGEIISSDEDVSALLFRITSQTATLTVPVFNDGVAEGTENYTFTLLDGEQYQVDPNASAVSVTIEDKVPLIPVFGTLDGEVFEAVLTPGFDGSNDIVFGGSGDDLIDSSAGSGGNRLYGQSGDDVFILGSNDRVFGGAGDDKFYLLGSGNVISGSAGADEFWVALGEIPETSNTITDFELASDVIGISGLGLSFADLTLTQEDGNALIASGDQELAKLLGTNANSLSADNFAFV